MHKRTLISESEIPKDFFSIEMKPISKKTQNRLKIAAEKANENIRRNNSIYRSSNAHSGGYPISSNSGAKGLTLKKTNK